MNGTGKAISIYEEELKRECAFASVVEYRKNRAAMIGGAVGEGGGKHESELNQSHFSRRWSRARMSVLTPAIT